MKLNLGLIGLLFLSTLACQNNSKTTEASSVDAEVPNATEVLLSEPFLRKGLSSNPASNWMR